jgi:hypothetical protein
MSLLAMAVIGVFSVWFLMTAIVQLPFRRCRAVRVYDPVGHLLPGWNFFAPKPVRADFAVWYRSWPAFDNDKDEVAADPGQPWAELAGIEQRRLTDGLVNPGRYARKSIFTCCHRIVALARRAGSGPGHANGLPADEVLVSLPYLLLLNKVTALSAAAVAVQFRIDVVRGDAGTPLPATAFVSAVHRVLPERSSEQDVASS